MMHQQYAPWPRLGGVLTSPDVDFASTVKAGMWPPSVPTTASDEGQHPSWFHHDLHQRPHSPNPRFSSAFFHQSRLATPLPLPL